MHLLRIWKERSLFSIKFSFEWVYFQGAKPRGFPQFTLKNDASGFSAYNNYYCHDTGRSFEAIFMKFTWLVRVHTRVNDIYFFLNNQSNRITDMGDNVPPKLVFDFYSASMGFLRKKIESHSPYPISHIKSYIHFCRPILHSLKNGHAPTSQAPPPKKNYLSRLFWKDFFKNCYLKSTQNLIS